ncbi:MAG: mechanosensitive ion channel [Clostridia bacterium]|nr:mechanosensitive ion channel [Clostridia bacterium]
MKEFLHGLPNAAKNVLRSNWRAIFAFVCFLIVGYIAVKIATSVFGRAMDRSRLRGATGHFLTTLVKTGLIALYVIILLAMLGVDTTSLVAIFSVLTLAVSLAVQGVISNLASGIMLVVTKPFEEGDFVDIGGTSGTVEGITISATRLSTPDNKVVILPNSTVTAANITNYSTKGTRRLDLVLSVAYGTDVTLVKRTVLGVIARHTEIFSTPPPTVRLSEHAEGALHFTVRVWLSGSDYWSVNFDLKEEIYDAFNEKGIEIPFPQMDVHLKQ